VPRIVPLRPVFVPVIQPRPDRWNDFVRHVTPPRRHAPFETFRL
jgi:hypothetical protein